MKQILLRGEIDVNCYFIEHNQKCYIVDPGYEKERVVQYVEENNLEVLGILLTHGHIDHIGAIDAFHVPVYLHKNEVEIIRDNYKNGFDFYGRTKPYKLEDIQFIEIDENTKLPIDDKQIEVIFTPGHTIGGVCYKLENQLFTGDTLFKGTVGKWTFPTGDLATLQKSVIRLMESQDDEVEIFPAHGASSTIGEEKRNNFFYLQWTNQQV